MDADDQGHAVDQVRGLPIILLTPFFDPAAENFGLVALFAKVVGELPLAARLALVDVFADLDASVLRVAVSRAVAHANAAVERAGAVGVVAAPVWDALGLLCVLFAANEKAAPPPVDDQALRCG